ncbi:DEAD-domain-containing protein [Zopfia rhizophila CBS 207.26]|uniref:DEAD-domain-containing protein n=1 Tax=Zopfia rhizophila CBS 207.26 TaxID=1314779 RepID=A0A6A6DZY3_9PEZI|nr:DEAD-domain-containing protein [Zopfia rhizophila CBS 207.26]
MNPLERIEGLSECIARAIQEHLSKSYVQWPFAGNLNHPILRVEAFLEDGDRSNASNAPPERIASMSRTLDLTGIITPAQSRSPTINPPETNNQPLLDSYSARETAIQVNDHEARSADGEPAERRTSEDMDVEMDGQRRKGIGGLRISQAQSIEEDRTEHQRRIQSDNRNFPKRRKIVSEKFVFQPSTLDKLIIGIWEQIHGNLILDPRPIFEQFQMHPPNSFDAIQPRANMTVIETLGDAATSMNDYFNKMNIFCRKVTQASRVCRSIEIIVQARWVELFESQVQLRIATIPDFSAAKHRKATFMEACHDFGWSEKELRNKMAIWRGYKEVKDAAGWAALVFTGMGIYRFCKYRVGFDKDAMRRLQNLRNRLEVAADTLHPNWRQVLSIVGETSKLKYTGHPHDWVVFEDGSDPVPLRTTYLQDDPYFGFEHLDESIVDENAWGCDDPRWIPQSDPVARAQDTYFCDACGEQQSDDPESNSCFCFPKFFGCIKRSATPVQVFQTPDGRNNGLLALTAFERGAAIGEFVGLITKGVRHQDVMDSSTSLSSYQIWQGRQGNYTRFVNHSCKANAQFQQFTWLDTQRVILVSKGIEAGTEVTVDYSDRYWGGLDKQFYSVVEKGRYHDVIKELERLYLLSPVPQTRVITMSTILNRRKYKGLEKAHQSSLSYSSSSQPASDEELSDRQNGSRKRRKLSPSPEELESNPKIPFSTISRIQAKKTGLIPKQNAETDTVSAELNGKEKTSFASINVSPWLIASLSAMEIKRPTGIQKACVPEILKGRDCIGGSRTGTGKTIAFAVPILQKWAEDPVGIFAVIITELAIQIFEQVKAISTPQSLKPVLITGGADQREQALNLASRPHVVIATPGRLAEHIKTSGEDTICGLRRVRFVVFDEADRLLAPGKGSMLPDLETCLSVLPPATQRQTLLFTATVTPEVLALKEQPRPGRPPIFICEVDTETLAIPPKLQQKYLQTPVTHKECYLHVLLSTPENVNRSVIIFCNRTNTATLLEYMLRLLEHRVTALHSGLQQYQRVANLGRFRAQAARILVATDVAARGLDIPEVALVVNYDVPRDPDDYIHRVGRTARAGRRDVELILAIEARVGKKMDEYEEEGVSIEGRIVRDALKIVSEKKREAMLQIEEGRDVVGKRKKGMQKSAKS